MGQRTSDSVAGHEQRSARARARASTPSSRRGVPAPGSGRSPARTVRSSCWSCSAPVGPAADDDRPAAADHRRHLCGHRHRARRGRGTSASGAAGGRPRRGALPARVRRRDRSRRQPCSHDAIPTAWSAPSQPTTWCRTCRPSDGVVQEAVATAHAGYLVTVGITPTHPATGFGYVGSGLRLAARPGRTVGLLVEEFGESRDETTARRYVDSGSLPAGMPACSSPAPRRCSTATTATPRPVAPRHGLRRSRRSGHRPVPRAGAGRGVVRAAEDPIDTPIAAAAAAGRVAAGAGVLGAGRRGGRHRPGRCCRPLARRRAGLDGAAGAEAETPSRERPRPAAVRSVCSVASTPVIALARRSERRGSSVGTPDALPVADRAQRPGPSGCSSTRTAGSAGRTCGVGVDISARGPFWCRRGWSQRRTRRVQDVETSLRCGRRGRPSAPSRATVATSPRSAPDNGDYESPLNSSWRDSAVPQAPAGTLYRGREGMWSWVAHRVTGVADLLLPVRTRARHRARTRLARGLRPGHRHLQEPDRGRSVEAGLVAAILFHALNGLRVIARRLLVQGPALPEADALGRARPVGRA